MIPIEKLNKETERSIEKYFLIKNYDSSSFNVDSFVIKEICYDIKSLERGKDNIFYLYFRESRRTNLESINSNPRVIDRYSFDFDYIGSFAWREKLDPKEIEVTYRLKEKTLFRKIEFSCVGHH